MADALFPQNELKLANCEIIGKRIPLLEGDLELEYIHRTERTESVCSLAWPKTTDSAVNRGQRNKNASGRFPLFPPIIQQDVCISSGGYYCYVA